jgi:hypothetical protein
MRWGKSQRRTAPPNAHRSQWNDRRRNGTREESYEVGRNSSSNLSAFIALGETIGSEVLGSSHPA